MSDSTQTQSPDNGSQNGGDSLQRQLQKRVEASYGQESAAANESEAFLDTTKWRAASTSRAAGARVVLGVTNSLVGGMMGDGEMMLGGIEEAGLGFTDISEATAIQRSLQNVDADEERLGETQESARNAAKTHVWFNALSAVPTAARVALTAPNPLNWAVNGGLWGMRLVSSVAAKDQIEYLTGDKELRAKKKSNRFVKNRLLRKIPRFEARATQVVDGLLSVGLTVGAVGAAVAGASVAGWLAPALGAVYYGYRALTTDRFRASYYKNLDRVLGEHVNAGMDYLERPREEEEEEQPTNGDGEGDDGEGDPADSDNA